MTPSKMLFKKKPSAMDEALSELKDPIKEDTSLPGLLLCLHKAGFECTKAIGKLCRTNSMMISILYLLFLLHLILELL